MIAIPQSVTRRIPLKAYLSSDHITAATGKTIAIVLSKNGGAFANPSAGATNATEISAGWYYVDLSTTDTNTTGPLIVRGTANGVDDVETYRAVVDPHNQGFDGVPSATAGASGGLLLVGSGSGAINPSGGKVPATLASTDVTGNVPTDLQTIKTQAVTAAAGVTFPSSVASPTNITAGTITTTTNLTNAPTAGDFTSAMKSSLNAATPSVTVSDKTGFSLSSAGIQAIWDALTSALTTVGSIGKLLVTNIDAAISSRSTYAGGAVASVTAPVTVGTNNDKTGYALTSAYDPAKTAAQAGDAMALTSGERTTLTGVIWAAATRTLTSFGTLTTDTATAVWAAATRTLTAFGFTVATNSDANVTAIKAKTDNLPADPASNTEVDTRLAASAYTAPPSTSAIATAIGAHVPIESYAANGTPPTNDQFAYMIWAVLAQFAVQGATISVKKLDGTTQAMTFTMDSATTPTLRTRAT